MLKIEPNVSAYFSSESQSWVRMEKQEDGEFSHLSGFPTYLCALLNTFKVYREPPMPSFLTEDLEVKI